MKLKLLFTYQYSSYGSLWCDSIPGAGGKGSGEGGDEAWQETERVLACEAEVDERQDDASVDDVAQDRSKDVFSQTSDQKNHIFHLNNLTAHQEHDAKRDIPERNNKM